MQDLQFFPGTEVTIAKFGIARAIKLRNSRGLR
jgi:hypothetical protein